MIRIAIISILIIFIIAVGFQISVIFSKERKLEKELEGLESKTEFFSSENVELESQINFLSRWENFEKELKSKFNYKNIGEKLMILIP